jgi:hypothetical protein
MTRPANPFRKRILIRTVRLGSDVSSHHLTGLQTVDGASLADTTRAVLGEEASRDLSEEFAEILDSADRTVGADSDEGLKDPT